MKTFGITAVCLVALALVGIATGIVNIHYAKRIDNQPLENPIVVDRLDENRILLQDGRSIELFDGPLSDRLTRLLQAYGEVEIEIIGGNGDFLVYGKEAIFVCGGTSPFRIPLIPHDVNRFKRSLVGTGSFIETSKNAEQGMRDDAR